MFRGRRRSAAVPKPLRHPGWSPRGRSAIPAMMTAEFGDHGNVLGKQ